MGSSSQVYSAVVMIINMKPDEDTAARANASKPRPAIVDDVRPT